MAAYHFEVVVMICCGVWIILALLALSATMLSSQITQQQEHFEE